MRTRPQSSLLAAVALLAASAGCRAGAPVSPELASAVAGVAPGSEVRVLVTLAQSAAPGLDPISARRAASAAAWDELRHWLAVRAIDRSGAGGSSAPTWLWGTGAAAVTVEASRLRELATAPGVVALRLDAAAEAPRPFGAPQAAMAAPATTPWNLAAIGAPTLWSDGQTGTGATVAILDTGVDLLHPDLGPRFRGGADDWFDPYAQHAAPADTSGHGTGVAGLVLGGDASGGPLGVAPGARWIAAKVYDDAGLATLSAIHRALQWAADPDGDPVTADRPDAVVLAFTFPTLVGRCWREFEPDVALLRSVGVLVVMAAGNTGAGATEPPANNPGGFPIGAVDATGARTAFTSHGASACLAGPYPALLAPGDLVRTAAPVAFALPGGPYTTVSGTSFAAPQVAGAVALLRGARPGASVDALEEALVGSAAAVSGSEAGRLDLVAARARLLEGSTAPLALDDDFIVPPGGLAIAAPGPLANDLSPTPLASTVLVPPAAGTLTLQADGSFTYRPLPLFSGEDRFVYLASGLSGSSPATVTLHVSAVP